MKKLVTSQFVKSAVMWSAAFGGLFALFFLATFPFGELQGRLADRLAARTGVNIRAAEWSLAWPLGLEWHEVTVQRGAVPSFGLDRFRFTLSPTSLLTGSPALRTLVELPGAGGRSGGVMTTDLRLGAWSTQDLASLGIAVDVPDVSTLNLGYAARGSIKALLTQHWPDLSHVSNRTWLLQGEKELQIELSNVYVETAALAGEVLPDLTIDHGVARLRCRDAQCEILGLEGQGPDGTVRGQGALTLRLPLESSLINASLAVEPAGRFAAFKSMGRDGTNTAIRLRIAGSLSRPRVVM